MSEVSQIVDRMAGGSPDAAERLLAAVYGELRKLAAARLAREKPGHTLEATALVHEAYLRLIDVERPQQWNSRNHFFAAAAEAMRRILVENARRKRRLKHGGGRRRRDLAETAIVAPEAGEDLLALDEALSELGKIDPFKVQLVQLRFFCGLTVEEAADALGVSAITAKRHWRYVRAWLHERLSDD